MPTPIYSIDFVKPVDWVRRFGEPPIIVTRHPDGTASFRYAKPDVSYDEYRASQMYSGTKGPLSPWEEHLRRHGAYGLRHPKPPEGCESALWLDLKISDRVYLAGAANEPTYPLPETTIRAEALKYATSLGLTKETSRQVYRSLMVEFGFPHFANMPSFQAEALRDFFESYQLEGEDDEY